MMDAERVGILSDVQPAVYRAAFKIRSLQKLCQMHAVRMRSLRPAMQSLGRAVAPEDTVTKWDVESCLQRLFDCMDQELAGQARPGAAEHTVRLLFKLFDREQTGAVCLHSVETVMIALSGDTLSAKHAALFELAVRCSGVPGRPRGVMTQSGLRVVLYNLSQIPGAVQESRVFGHVDSAVASCFHRVLSAGASEMQFGLWLRSEPRLLLWLSALDKISLGEAIVHPVRCQVCKASPVVGLRYRCLRCLNLHLCQTCFVSQRGTSKHRPFHMVQVHCTQPTLKEALFSLVHSVRHKLMRRRPARKEVERSSSLTGAQLSAHASTLQAGGAIAKQRPESKSRDSHPNVESKAMQTDPVPVLPSQEKVSLRRRDRRHARGLLQDPQTELRRARSFVCSLSSWQVEPGSSLHAQLTRQLEKQLQVGRACVQAENSWLKEKCSQLEATTEILAQHNQNLQEELHRVQRVLGALSKDEKKCIRDNKRWKPEEKTDQISPREEGGRSTPEGSQQPPEMTITPGPGKGPGCLTYTERPQLEAQQGHELQQETGVGGGGTSQSLSSVALEEQLSDLVQQLKLALSQDPETVCPAPASVPGRDLLEAAENVGNSISRLVSAISLMGPFHRPCPVTSAFHSESDL